MGRPIGVEKKAEILALADEGHTCSEIGRRVGVERHTVKKYVDAELARVAGEEEVVAQADAEKFAAKVPAGRMTEAEFVKLRWLLEFVEFLPCECGLRLPYPAHVPGEMSLKCLRCGLGWAVTVKPNQATA